MAEPKQAWTPPPPLIRGALGARKGSVMVSQLRDMDCIFGDLIDKSVFIGNSPGPVAGKGMFQWFRLVPFPFSSWAMDSINRLVFFGDRKR